MNYALDRLLSSLSLLKDYAKDYVLENTGLKVLALLITAVLWLSVASRPVRQITVHSVPIEFRGLGEDLEPIVPEDTPVFVRVNLRGPRDVLDTIRASELTAVADLSGVEAGVRVIRLTLDRTRLPASVEERGIEPGTIRVTLEPLIEREVPIEPRWEGSPPQGYEIYSSTINPSTVRIVGAASAVSGVARVSTETINLSGRTEPFSTEVSVDPGLSNVHIKEEHNRKVMLTVVIGEVRKERVLERLPVVIIGAPDSAQPVPRFVNVTLYGSSSAIDTIAPSDLLVSVEYRSESSGGPIKPNVNILNDFSNRLSVTNITPEAVRIK